MSSRNIIAAFIVALAISQTACVGKVGGVDLGTAEQWVALPGQVGEALLTTPASDEYNEYSVYGSGGWTNDTTIMCMNIARNMRKDGEYADATAYEAMCRDMSRLSKE